LPYLRHVLLLKTIFNHVLNRLFLHNFNLQKRRKRLK